jgi:hypothetical protein
MTRGGRRPGAGARRNNLNAMKNGIYSMQMIEAVLASDPAIWKVFLARMKDNKHRARASLAATMLWIRIGVRRRKRGRPGP